METTIEELVTEAVRGSRKDLEEVVHRIQGRVHTLALRMLFHPADAEDAVQEILIKVVIHLKSFRFEGPFRAWVMKIAANHLCTVRRGRAEKLELTMEKAQGFIDRAEAMGWFSTHPGAPRPLMELEMRSACTQALLLALDRSHRLAFVLGMVMDVSSREGGLILNITPAAFRKRLSRARRRVMDFLRTNCGLFNESNPCRCGGVLAVHVKKGWIDPQRPLFAAEQPDDQDGNMALGAYMKELDELGRVSALYKSFPKNEEGADFTALVKDMVEKGEYRVLGETGTM
ncbi:MAG: RNA polymerase sigma factor [Deltaproteobacteria bacterium]|nr:RNA polymerase sigma factor [Deltaproteobacteria bacterium]